MDLVKPHCDKVCVGNIKLAGRRLRGFDDERLDTFIDTLVHARGNQGFLRSSIAKLWNGRTATKPRPTA
jgi:hypothetical protein